MRILVVDDEFYARKALVKMIDRLSQQRHFIDEAADGSAAQNLLETHEYQLLFSDIRMPGISGLELIAGARKRWPKLLSVVVSGYSDFEYAQKALRSSVLDYLLKPVDPEQLVQILHQAQTTWMQEAISSNPEKSKVSQYLERDNDLAMLHGLKPIDDQMISKLRANQPEPAAWQLIILQGRGNALQEHQEHLQPACHDAFRDMHFCIFHAQDWQEILLVICSDCDLLSKAGHLFSSLRNKTNCELSLGISAIRSDVMELSKAYQEALAMINQRLFTGWNKIYPFNHDVIRLDHIYFSREAEAQLKLFLMHGDKNAARQLVKQTLLQAVTIHPIRILCFQEAFLKMIQSIHEVFRSIFGEQSVNPIINEHLRLYHKLDAFSFSDIEEMAIYLDELASVTAVAALSRMGKQGSQQLVNDIKKYIEENYQQDISFNHLASHHFFKNPSYLSRVFKVTCGQTLSQYLLKVRMNKARQLLEQASLKITEIAKEVGYNDASHFIQMFKKCVGETPDEYRCNRKQQKI